MLKNKGMLIHFFRSIL